MIEILHFLPRTPWQLHTSSRLKLLSFRSTQQLLRCSHDANSVYHSQPSPCRMAWTSRPGHGKCTKYVKNRLWPIDKLRTTSTSFLTLLSGFRLDFPNSRARKSNHFVNVKTIIKLKNTYHIVVHYIAVSVPKIVQHIDISQICYSRSDTLQKCFFCRPHFKKAYQH